MIAQADLVSVRSDSPEMNSHCLDYCEYCLSFGEPIAVEAKLPLFYSPEEFCTADYISYDAVIQTLHIIDLKYGKGISVDAYNNLQLTIYAICALDAYHTQHDIKHVKIHIYQPRLNHVSTALLSRQHMEYERNRLIDIIDVLDTDITHPLTPGDSQCQWCLAKPKCPALAAHTYEVVKADFEDLETTPQLPDIVAMSDSDIGHMLKHKDLFIKYLNSLEAYAFERLSCGHTVPGHKLVEGRSNRVWTDPEAAMKMCKKKLLVSERYSIKAKTPPQILKLLSVQDLSKRFTNKLNTFIKKPKGRPVVAKDSDKRPAIQPLLDFSNLDTDVKIAQIQNKEEQK